MRSRPHAPSSPRSPARTGSPSPRSPLSLSSSRTSRRGRATPASVLGSIKVDPVQGTTLYDGLVRAASRLETEPLPARVIIVVTDGNETRSSHAPRRGRRRQPGRRGRLRRRDREPEVQPGAAEAAGGGDRRRLPGHVLERNALGRVRVDRLGASPHLAPRLSDEHAPRRRGDPAGPLERLLVEGDRPPAAGEPRARSGRSEALAPAPGRLLPDRPRHPGDGARLVLHRPLRGNARADDREGLAAEERHRAAPRHEHGRPKAQAGAEGALRRRSGLPSRRPRAPCSITESSGAARAPARAQRIRPPHGRVSVYLIAGAGVVSPRRSQRSPASPLPRCSRALHRADGHWRPGCKPNSPMLSRHGGPTTGRARSA